LFLSNKKNVSIVARKIKAKAQYQQKMEKIFNQIQQILPAYDQAMNSVKLFMYKLYRQSNVDYTKTVENITNQLESVAEQAYPIYKEVGTISADDRTSYLILVLKSLSDMYNNLISYQVQQLNNQKKDDAYYKGLSDSSKKILGTNNPSDSSLVRYGYNGIITNIMKKYISSVVKVGKLKLGGDNPVAVQSMCNTDTRDVKATVKQILALEKEGCEIVRVAVPDMEAAKAIGKIKAKIRKRLFHIELPGAFWSKELPGRF